MLCHPAATAASAVGTSNQARYVLEFCMHGILLQLVCHRSAASSKTSCSVEAEEDCVDPIASALELLVRLGHNSMSYSMLSLTRYVLRSAAAAAGTLSSLTILLLRLSLLSCSF